MTKLKNFLLIIALFTLSGMVHAASAWSENLTVDIIEGSGAISVYFVETPLNPAGCTTNNKAIAVDSAANTELAKNFLTLALTAKTTGRPVDVLIDGSDCLWGSWRKVLSIRLK